MNEESEIGAVHELPKKWRKRAEDFHTKSADETQTLYNRSWAQGMAEANDTLQFRSAREHDDERHICPQP